MTHMASLSAVETAAFFLQVIPFFDTECIQLCTVNLHVVFLSDLMPLGSVPVAFLIVVTSQDIPPPLPFGSSWFAVGRAS